MPDALSKTVPIWCTVINRTLFPEASAFHEISFPPEFLPKSEESQIESRIDGFVQSLKVLSLFVHMALTASLIQPGPQTRPESPETTTRKAYTGGMGKPGLLPPQRS